MSVIGGRRLMFRGITSSLPPLDVCTQGTHLGVLLIQGQEPAGWVGLLEWVHTVGT